MSIKSDWKENWVYFKKVMKDEDEFIFMKIILVLDLILLLLVTPLFFVFEAFKKLIKRIEK